MNGKSDFEIEFIEAGHSARPAPEIPKNAVQVGQVLPGDVRVYIGQEILRQLDAVSCFDVRKETGSFLVGDYVQKDGATCAIVTGFIDARYTDASSASLTFTHKTWSYVSEQLEQRFLACASWAGTIPTPNYGVFLSEYDLFIQENFFNLPYQVAYVVDPVCSHKGLFCLETGQGLPAFRVLCVWQYRRKNRAGARRAARAAQKEAPQVAFLADARAIATGRGRCRGDAASKPSGKRPFARGAAGIVELSEKSQFIA